MFPSLLMAGKTVQPPPLPLETLHKVLRLASLDARMLIVVAGTFALLAAAGREVPGALAGVLAVGAGTMELHGANRLREGVIDGGRWLITSQMWLLAVILGYCAWRLTHFDPAWAERVITPQLELQFNEAGIPREDIPAFVQLVYQITYVIVAVVSIVYQGGMAWYYRSKRSALTLALGSR